MTERETDGDQNLHGSLHSLRGEYEEIQDIYRTRRQAMPEAQVEMNVRKASEKVSIIDVHGELTAFAESVLMDAYNQASDGQVRAIILNFEDVDYINSTGIALIVGLLARARSSKRRLLACNLSEHYVEIFNVTRLSDFMRVLPDEESAIAEASLS